MYKIDSKIKNDYFGLSQISTEIKKLSISILVYCLFLVMIKTKNGVEDIIHQEWPQQNYVIYCFLLVRITCTYPSHNSLYGNILGVYVVVVVVVLFLSGQRYLIVVAGERWQVFCRINWDARKLTRTPQI